MQWVIDEAGRRGGNISTSRCSSTITGPAEFYERWGFVAEGRYAFMVGSHADEDVVMRRPL